MIDYATGVSSGEKVIVQNSYDDVGQLKTKRLGVNGTTAVETQKYDYNVRGWLLGVNRDYVNNTQSTSKFGFELSYDKPASMNPTNAPLYNGNIATMTWRGNQNGADIRRYDFAYDNTSRLLKADFKALTGTVQSGTFNSQMGDGINPESAYDYNGNILAMTQQGLYGGASTTIDQLTYTYIPGTNKLQKVTDGQTANLNLGDFYNGNTGDNIDYSYDDNGNLKQDLNKNITDIGYNYLNLPENISVAGKGSIVYSYDGVGNKLTKTVNETGQPQKVTVYLGNLIFENNALQFVNTEEGRARLESGAWKYDYFLKDHLGNVRMMLDDNGNVLEETHYYPFGLIQKGISTSNPIPSLRNKDKTFQGQKFDDDLGLSYYSFKYRNHDPQIGRFIEIDPLSDKYEFNSTYSFSENKVTTHVELEGLEKIHFQYVFDLKQITVSSTNLERNGPLGSGYLLSSNHGGKAAYYYGREIAPSLTAFKKAYEGVKLDKNGDHVGYLDHLGNPTIGYGHLIKKGEKYKVGSTITDREAQSLFETESESIIKQSDAYLKDYDLSENERGALYDAAFNMGPGKLKQYTEDGSKFSRGNIFFQFMGGGEGIKKRRYAENILYTNGKYIHFDVLNGKDLQRVLDFLTPLQKEREDREKKEKEKK